MGITFFCGQVTVVCSKSSFFLHLELQLLIYLSPAQGQLAAVLKRLDPKLNSPNSHPFCTENDRSTWHRANRSTTISFLLTPPSLPDIPLLEMLALPPKRFIHLRFFLFPLVPHSSEAHFDPIVPSSSLPPVFLASPKLSRQAFTSIPVLLDHPTKKFLASWVNRRCIRSRTKFYFHCFYFVNFQW